MITTTMPVSVPRTQSQPAKDTSQIMPFLLAIALLAATAVVSTLISGPMH